MADLLVGDWECSFEEIMPLFDNDAIFKERKLLSKYLRTSQDFMDGLEADLERNKLTSLNAMIEILVEWTSRNSKTATLGVLLKIMKRRYAWKPVSDSIRELLMKKALTWSDLDDDSKDQFVNTQVEFQGNTFKLENLKFLMSINFDQFLSKHVHQSVIQQAINHETLKMKAILDEGFITNSVLENTNHKNEIKFENSKDSEMGTGSGNTVVYKGTFGRTKVAVKKILSFRQHEEAENEINFLVSCNGHQNIVRYFAFEKHDDYYLLALELCQKNTLKDWIVNSKCLPVEIDGLEILRQTTEGLDFLHEKNIIHRDLKPSNILFSIYEKHVFVRIADFGISRLLPPGESSKTVTSYGGSCGWTAAEMLEARQIYNATGDWGTPGIPKLTKKVDIFSIGCIFYTVLTHGKHPFGDEETLYEHCIKQGCIQTSTENARLSLKCNIALIHKMISRNPDKRPDTEYIRSHPIFWSNQKLLDFVIEISNFSFKSDDPKIKACVQRFETNYFPKIISDNLPHFGWFGSLSYKLRKVFQEAGYSYYQGSAKMLNRLIRNLGGHLDENTVPKAVRDVIGEKPHDFMRFWMENFPSLIIELRDAFTDFSSSSSLEQYFVLKSDIQEEVINSGSLSPVFTHVGPHSPSLGFHGLGLGPNPMPFLAPAHLSGPLSPRQYRNTSYPGPPY